MAKSPLELANELNQFRFTGLDASSIWYRHKDSPWIKNYKFKDANLDEIAKDTNLDNDMSMAERRPEWWGNDINKYKISYDDLKHSYYDNPIRVKLGKDGKWQILDGHHRIKALRNMGYNKAPLFVKEE
jgi:hypothetical protein